MNYPPYSSTSSRPIVIDSSVEAQVYGLFALAIGLTTVGVYIGSLFAQTLFSSGLIFMLFIAELAIIFTSSWWMNKSPLNYILFSAFPVLSGITLAPLILSLISYPNGTSILLNALGATACMGLAAAVFARTTSWNLGAMGKALIFAVLGLIVLALFQVFVPSLRTGTFDLMLSGAGVIIFSLFNAYDVQRIQQMSRYGANPFMLALSLYMDIYNLFLYVLRLMTAISGDRR